MQRRLDKSLLRRLHQLEPPIESSVLADTLCDGELLAVVLDRWVVAQFVETHGVLVNVAIRDNPGLLERIPSIVAQSGPREAERQLNKYYDFEILNDPACPRPVLKYILETLARLWETQARAEFPTRSLTFAVGWNAEEGVDGAYFIEMISAEAPRQRMSGLPSDFELSVEVASVPDRDGRVAEVQLGRELLAELRREQGELRVEVYSAPEGGSWDVPYQEFTDALRQAKDKLGL